MPGNQTRRRRKRRGTQSGRIDTRPGRGRPRNREEARQRARARAKQKRGIASGDRRNIVVKPSWRSAANRGVVAALIFLGVLVLILQRPFAQAIALCVFMLALYIPMGYFIDTFVYKRRMAALQREREQRA